MSVRTRLAAPAAMLFLALVFHAGEASAQNIACRDNAPADSTARITCTETSGSTADITIAPGTVAISTTIMNQQGILADHMGTGRIAVTMSAGTIMTGANAISAFGVEASHGGSGAVSFTMTGGSIATAARTTAGFRGAHRSGSGTGNITVSMSGGSIVAAGALSEGMVVTHRGTGFIDITLSDNGRIESTLHGVSADHAGSGNVVILMKDTFSVTTTGNSAYGVGGAQSSTGDLTLTLEGGTITTRGLQSVGLNASAIGGGTGNIGVTVKGGSIMTTNLGSEAVKVRNIRSTAGAVKILIENDAQIRTEGGTATTG